MIEMRLGKIHPLLFYLSNHPSHHEMMTASKAPSTLNPNPRVRLDRDETREDDPLLFYLSNHPSHHEMMTVSKAPRTLNPNPRVRDDRDETWEDDPVLPYLSNHPALPSTMMMVCTLSAHELPSARRR